MSVSIEIMHMCSSNEGWKTTVQGSSGTYEVVFDRHSHKNPNVQCDFSCTCQAYQFGKKGKYCKHILAVKDKFCGWHEQMHGGTPVDGKCPQCGRDVVAIKVAV